MISVATDFFWNVIGFLQTYNGAVTAVATVAIGIFTLVLVIVTRRQAILTKQSVRISERALTELERPYIFFHRIRSNVQTYLMTNTSWTQESQSPEFFPGLINYGRTPGNMVFAAILFEVGRSTPEEFLMPKGEEPLADPSAEWAEIVIGPHKKYRFPSQRVRHIFPFAYAAGMRDETMFMYCHGFIAYRDIFGKTHTTKWCRRYNARRNEWQPEGGNERNNAV